MISAANRASTDYGSQKIEEENVSGATGSTSTRALIVDKSLHGYTIQTFAE